MAIYNTTFMNNATNILDLALGIGTAVNTGETYLIGQLIMLAFFIVVLSASLRYDFNTVLLVDCFLTTLLGAMLLVAGLVQAAIVVAPAVTFFIVLVFFFFNKK